MKKLGGMEHMVRQKGLCAPQEREAVSGGARG